jgi:hypothetical protein
MRNAVLIGLLAAAALVVTLQPARAQSHEDVEATIKNFEKGDPGMQAWFREAHGYAVLPSVATTCCSVSTVRSSPGSRRPGSPVISSW